MKKLLLVILALITLCSATTLFAASDLRGVIVYPNPFNVSKGHTTITFENLTTDDVVIKVYKITGELVKTIEGKTSTGIIGWWDVTNDNGKELGSGAYVYVITNSAGQKAIGKFAVVK